MAAVDAAQLDFTSPFLRNQRLPVSQKSGCAPSPREPRDEPVQSSPRAISNPNSCAAARLQVNKAPGGFIALLGFVPLCYSPRLNLLPWRQEQAQAELPSCLRCSGGTVTLSGCLT